MSYSLFRKDLGAIANNSVTQTATVILADQTGCSMIQEFIYGTCIKSWHFVVLKDILKWDHSLFEKVILEKAK